MKSRPLIRADRPVESDEHAAVARIDASPVIPAEVHGFAVRVGVGPYPPGEPRPGRRAVYAELVPVSDRARSAMQHAGRPRILGMVPVTPGAADEVLADPHGGLAEHLTSVAVSQASRLARATA